MTGVGKQFEQLSMFARRDLGPEGSPANESPEQFRDHPQTTFHASYVKIPRNHQRGMPHGRDFAGIHTGTYQAAAERSMSYGYAFHDLPDEKRADGKTWEGSGDPKIVFHPVSHRDNPLPEDHHLGSAMKPLTDEEANDPNFLDGSHRPLAYTNAAEDVGSVSVVFPNHAVPARLQQGDWVKEAVRDNQEAGRRDDYGIHPRTWHLYQQGNLDNYDQKSFHEVKNEINRDSAEEIGGGLFPYRMSRPNPAFEPTDPKSKPYTDRVASREEVTQHVQGMLHQIQFNPEADRGIWGQGRARLEKVAQNPYHDVEDHPSLIPEQLRAATGDAINRVSSDMKMYGITPPKEKPASIWRIRKYARPYGDLGDPRRGKQFGGENV